MALRQQRCRCRPELRTLWFGATVIAVACLLSACESSGSTVHSDSAPPSPSADPHATTPSGSGTGTASPPVSPATVSASSGCLAGSATIMHSVGDASVRSLCVRSGTTVTVVLEPLAHSSWPQPRSSNPMLALVTSSATDGKGVTRVTVRAARIGAVTVTWGSENAPLFTLRLSVAAYPVR